LNVKKISAGLAIVLLTACSTIPIPTRSAEQVLNAPRSITLGSSAATLSVEVSNDGYKPGKTSLVVLLNGSSRLASTVNIQSFYVVSNNQVYKAAPSWHETFLDGNQRYAATLPTTLNPGDRVSVAALVTDGQNTELLQTPEPVKVTVIYVSSSPRLTGVRRPHS
jgi:hypothetical protein